jgi:RNA polymerase sigma-70 factor, ECF subfamily
MPFDDVHLAVQAAGDPQAFAALYDRYYPRVYSYMRYRCEDETTAEDLAAQVFERLLVTIQRYSAERGPFEAWLFAIARHAVADYYRRPRWQSWLPWEAARRQPAHEPNPEDLVIQRDLHARLRLVLPQLNDRQRDLLGLKFNSQLTNREIASLTGLTETNVAVIVYRTLQRLRDWLGEGELVLSSPWEEAEHERG